jgi:hypothetical protein
MAKKPKGKKVSYELIEQRSLIGAPMYKLLRDLVAVHHEELRDARIALAWCTSWKPDVDGRMTIGKCVKASDLHRELAPFDFVILLSRDFYTSPRATTLQRTALIDHELCHAAGVFDRKGEPTTDERGRRVYRIRRHDLEEFGVIAERYGCYKRDLVDFAESLSRAKNNSGPAYFISVQRLTELLQTVGLTIPPEVVQAWNQVERRDAEEWALIRIDLGKRAHSPATEVSEPGCITAYRASSALPFEAPPEATEPEPEPVTH